MLQIHTMNTIHKLVNIRHFRKCKGHALRWSASPVLGTGLEYIVNMRMSSLWDHGGTEAALNSQMGHVDEGGSEMLNSKLNSDYL